MNNKPRIYHLTHMRNLPSILMAGGLWGDREAAERGVIEQDIGHSHIKERRAKRSVLCEPYGFLCDYVPFYFHYHSPMLYAIHKGNVKGYKEGQEDVVYLVSSVDRVVQANLPFVFTDGHADMALTQQYNNLENLTNIDWTAVNAKQWADIEEGSDRKRRKQAEFLVHNFFPWHCIEGIGAINDQKVGEVQLALSKSPQVYKPKIKAVPTWYY